MYDCKTLKNGVRIVGQPMRGVRSISVGIWVRTGSVDELGEREQGISHFIEHMLFKGTYKRSARDIAQEMDEMGGILNAFTSKECTCYHVRISQDSFVESFELLTDIVRNSTLPSKELETEKNVVIEEINMSMDLPEDLVHELLAKAYFKDSPLALPILGTKKSVSAFSQDDLRRYMNRRYTPDKIVIAIAGGYDFTMVCETAERLWEDLNQIPNNEEKSENRFLPAPLIVQKKSIEQVHICFAMPAFSFSDDRIFPLAVFNNLFGGGMSSRLFQSVREERGLAYDIYSQPSAFAECGMMTVYTGANAENTSKVISLILSEFDKLQKEGISQDEFTRAQKQLRGNYILGLESTSARMNAIGKSTIMNSALHTPEEVISLVDKITVDDIVAIIPHILDRNNMSISSVGNVDEADIRKVME